MVPNLKTKTIDRQCNYISIINIVTLLSQTNIDKDKPMVMQLLSTHRHLITDYVDR